MTGYNNDHIASCTTGPSAGTFMKTRIYSILRWTGSSAGLGYVVTRARSRNQAISSTRIGLQPVVMSRHSDGTVYVVYNWCPPRRESRQRGMRECRVSCACIMAGPTIRMAT